MKRFVLATVVACLTFLSAEASSAMPDEIIREAVDLLAEGLDGRREELVADKDNFIKFDKDKGVGIVCREFCFENNLVMRAVGDAMIISPPLVIGQADIDVFIERAWRCLDLTQKAIG